MHRCTLLKTVFATFVASCLYRLVEDVLERHAARVGPEDEQHIVNHILFEQRMDARQVVAWNLPPAPPRSPSRAGSRAHPHCHYPSTQPGAMVYEKTGGVDNIDTTSDVAPQPLRATEARRRSVSPLLDLLLRYFWSTFCHASPCRIVFSLRSGEIVAGWCLPSWAE